MPLLYVISQKHKKRKICAFYVSNFVIVNQVQGAFVFLHPLWNSDLAVGPRIDRMSGNLSFDISHLKFSQHTPYIDYIYLSLSSSLSEEKK